MYQYQACLYLFECIFMVISNVFMKLQNVVIFDSFVKFLTYRLHAPAAGKALQIYLHAASRVRFDHHNTSLRFFKC